MPTSPQADCGTLSRRQLLGRGAIAIGGLAGAGAIGVPGALAGKPGAAPKPIPSGFNSTFMPVPSNPVAHVLPPGIGFEMSTITDFKGVVGGSEIRGTARATDGSAYSFDTDMRFMVGKYVGMDGRLRERSFGFI